MISKLSYSVTGNGHAITMDIIWFVLIAWGEGWWFSVG